MQELVALAAHVLDENSDGDVQGAAAAHDEGVRGISGLDAEREVALELAVEPLLEVAGGDKLTLPACKGGGVDVEGHSDGGLLNLDRGEGLRAVGHDGLADADVGKPRDGADVAAETSRRWSSGSSCTRTPR